MQVKQERKAQKRQQVCRLGKATQLTLGHFLAGFLESPTYRPYDLSKVYTDKKRQ